MKHKIESNYTPAACSSEAAETKRGSMKNNEVLTLREAAEYLRFAPNAMLRMAAAGKIPAKKVGSKWRFSRRQLEQFIETPTPVPGRKIKAA
jgi:excisionase family DNA binding protein